MCSCTLLGALWRHALIPLTPGLAWATVGNLPLCQSTHLSLSSPRVSSYSFVLFLLFFICRTRFHPFSHLPVILMDQVIRRRNGFFLNNPFFESTCCWFEVEVRQELVGRGAPLMELFAPNLGTLTRLETSEPPAFAFFPPAVYYYLHAMARRPPGESEGKSD